MMIGGEGQDIRTKVKRIFFEFSDCLWAERENGENSKKVKLSHSLTVTISDNRVTLSSFPLFLPFA